MARILILAPYPWNEAPSQRFRFELFLKNTQENSLEYHFQSFYSIESWEKLYAKGPIWSKLYLLLLGFIRRKWQLLTLSGFDCVFIHRELAPLGPPIFEWWIAKVLKKKIIYDFDDAIWLADHPHESPFWRLLKWRSKVKSICKWSHKVSAGNNYLAEYARQYCDHVVVLPTVVNTSTHRPLVSPKQLDDRICIGWTGSHSTLPYLQEILPTLQRLQEDFDFSFLVIANQNPKLPLKNFQFLPWSKASEISDLSRIDIGIMPLPDNEWTKGKCGFKAIQYLAMGVPAVVSAVGANKTIVTHGENGYLCSSATDWKKYLVMLLQDPNLRKKLGQNGRKTIEEHYSVASQIEGFHSLFEPE